MIKRYIFGYVDFKHKDHANVSAGVDELSSRLAYGSFMRDGNGWGGGLVGMNHKGDGFGNGYQAAIETGSESGWYDA